MSWCPVSSGCNQCFFPGQQSTSWELGKNLTHSDTRVTPTEQSEPSVDDKPCSIIPVFLVSGGCRRPQPGSADTHLGDFMLMANEPPQHSSRFPVTNSHALQRTRGRKSSAAKWDKEGSCTILVYFILRPVHRPRLKREQILLVLSSYSQCNCHWSLSFVR